MSASNLSICEGRPVLSKKFAQPTYFRSGLANAPVRGFTLIELMIVVAIIAILAAVAFPAYQDSVWKGRRGEGKAAILRTMQSEERYYTSYNSYVKAPTAASSGVAIPAFSGDSLAKSTYTISADVCAGTTFGIDQCVAVVATTQGSPDPKCGDTLTVTSQGVKSAALYGAPISDPACW